MINLKIIALPLAALTLGACDMASEMAGDAIKGEMRTQFVAKCEQVAADNGFSAAMVTPACECSADKFSADAQGGELEINQARIQEVLKTCLQSQPDDTAGEAAE